MLVPVSAMRARIAPVEPLDNPVWHALTGPHREFAEQHRDRAARYHPEVTPFAALPDAASTDAWRALGHLAGSDGYPVLFRDVVEPPAGWEVVARFPTLQMVASPDLDLVALDESIEPLSNDDVDEMMALVERTMPGPFLRRTVELGGYVGIRRDGRLVAMAGRRVRAAGHIEVSAVCTDGDQRGKGLARALMAEVVARIRHEGQQPFLHVLTSNEPAIRMYERLGFVVRRQIDVAVVHPVA
jgi:ribosomal protein S18 acetylase RimI-like enzyme